MNFNPSQPFVTAITRIFGAAAPIVVSRIRSNPAIIRMLQDFNFDQTEHPPQDFDIIYACAVIKYDQSKTEDQWNDSDILAELFLKDVIKKAFDKSFYTQNYEIVKGEIDACVVWEEQDWNTLRQKIQELNIDWNQELEKFKDIFIELVKKSGKPLESYSIQKIEEISQKLDELLRNQNKNTDSFTYPPEFQSLITEKIKSFCGRKFVFTAFETFINTNKKGYFTVIGDAGMGKSTIAAKYVFEHKTICYFNNLQENRNSPELFLESIRQQLINRYQLISVDKDDLSTLLGKATEKITTNEKLIIIVDALDEVDQKPGGENILYLPKTLPDNVYFFLTRRPYDKERLQTEVKKESLDLTDDKYNQENQHDIQEYIRSCLKNDPEHKDRLQNWIENKNITPDAFVNELTTKSENNFMYLRYVLPAIAEGKYNDNDLKLTQLPQGLKDYYQTHWERMKMDDESQKIKVIVLYILVEFAKPIPCEKIAAITEKDEFDVQKILDEWIEYLRKQPEDGYDCYSIYHASFLNFLKPKKELNPEKRKQLLQEVNQKIINYYENIENNHG
jgi:hypothetical protein